MKYRNGLYLLCSAILMVGCGNGSPKESTSTVSRGSTKLLPPAGNNIYFGAFPDFGGSEDHVSAQKISAFETISGKRIGWAVFSQNWYNGLVYPKAAIEEIVRNGTVPYIRLMPRSNEEEGHGESIYSLQKIIDGAFDTALHAWAKEAKASQYPLLMDFAVEANGDWFPWSGIFNGGAQTDGYGDPNYPDGPERYRDAYRHIIDIFREEDVQNVTWFFHFNLESSPNAEWNRPKYYYPGDTYIDWIGFSVYGAQTVSEEWEGLSFSQQLARNWQYVMEIGANKPVAVLEFGVTDQHPEGSKSAWLNDAFTTILGNPYTAFGAVSPWHENWENEDGTVSMLRLDSSEETEATFKAWIGNDRFVSDLRF